MLRRSLPLNIGKDVKNTSFAWASGGVALTRVFWEDISIARNCRVNERLWGVCVYINRKIDGNFRTATATNVGSQCSRQHGEGIE